MKLPQPSRSPSFHRTPDVVAVAGVMNQLSPSWVVPHASTVVDGVCSAGSSGVSLNDAHVEQEPSQHVAWRGDQSARPVIGGKERPARRYLPIWRLAFVVVLVTERKRCDRRLTQVAGLHAQRIEEVAPDKTRERADRRRVCRRAGENRGHDRKSEIRVRVCRSGPGDRWRVRIEIAQHRSQRIRLR